MAKRTTHANGTIIASPGSGGDGRTVLVTRAGGMIHISPPVVAMNMITTRRAVEAGPDGPIRLRWQSSSVFRPAEDPHGNPVLVGPRHLEDLAAQVVRAGGGRPVVTGPPVPIWPAAASAEYPCPDAQALARIGRRPRLLVRYAAGVKPVGLLVQIAVMYPHVNMLFVAKTRKAVRAIAAALRAAGVEVSVFTGRRAGERPRTRVAVGTFRGVAHDDALLHLRDLVVVADAVDGLGGRADAVLALAPGRVVGLVRADARIPPADRTRLLALYGTAHVHVTAPGHTARGVVVSFVPYRGTRLARGLSPCQARRVGVWINTHRNKWVAGLAHDIASLKAVSVPTPLKRVLARRVQRGDRRVAVVAANAEHANRLLDQLPPGWAGVGDGVRPTSDGPLLPGWGQPAGAPHQLVVVTVGALNAFPLGTYDVVVRADGGAGPLPAGVDLGTYVVDDPTVLLVDIHDRFDRDLDRAARRRRAAYRRAGWAAADEPDGFGDLNVFLAWHPCGDSFRRAIVGAADTANDDMAEAPGDGPGRAADAIVETYPLSPLGPSTDAEVAGAFSDRPVGGLGGYTGGRRRRDRWAVAAGRPGYLPTVAEIARPDNLVAVLRNMMDGGAGAATGPDGIGLYDLSVADWAVHLRGLSRRVLDGTYVPGPVRVVMIPKGDGTFRSIEVGSVADRVWDGALERAASPFLDSLFLAGSFGFRPGRSHWHMLAALIKAVTSHKAYVVVNDDVKNCFPSARTDLVLADVERVIPDPGVMALLTAVVRGHGGTRREGLSTGSPISPLLLNTHLHFRHDLPVDRERFIVRWARYADNICYLVRSTTEGERALDLTRTLLNEVGLDLKGQKKGGERVPGEPIDLRENSTNLLGFDLTAEPDVTLEVPDDAWKSLTDALQEAHESNDPPAQARSTLLGWAAACGPALENRVGTTLQSILSTARQTGFPRVLTAERLGDALDEALRKWRRVLRDTPAPTQRPGRGGRRSAASAG